jgi:hypothetical protein
MGQALKVSKTVKMVGTQRVFVVGVGMTKVCIKEEKSFPEWR